MRALLIAAALFASGANAATLLPLVNPFSADSGGCVVSGFSEDELTVVGECFYLELLRPAPRFAYFSVTWGLGGVVVGAQAAPIHWPIPVPMVLVNGQYYGLIATASNGVEILEGDRNSGWLLIP